MISIYIIKKKKNNNWNLNGTGECYCNLPNLKGPSSSNEMEKTRPCLSFKEMIE